MKNGHWPRVISIGLVAAAGLIWSAPGAPAEAARQKAVYHFNQASWPVIRAGLGNIGSHLRVVGPKRVRIVVVVHGPGHVLVTKGLVPPEVVRTVEGLQRQGVEFRLCAQTMRKHNLRVGRNIAFRVRVVPCGACEVIRLQHQGFAYFKP